VEEGKGGQLIRGDGQNLRVLVVHAIWVTNHSHPRGLDVRLLVLLGLDDAERVAGSDESVNKEALE
jgi:hypothetical protein